jgi:hypothetical protein
VKTAINRNTRKNLQDGADRMFRDHVAVHNEFTGYYGKGPADAQDVGAWSRVHEPGAWCRNRSRVSVKTADDRYAIKRVHSGADRAGD